MELETTRFGIIEIKEEEIITFKQSLYGFEDEKEFILLEDAETDFFWLQSVTNPDLAFVVTEPWAFCPEYEFELTDEVKDELNLESKKEVLVVNIVVIPEDPQGMTMNLKAPIVINEKERTAKQLILEEEYPVKYRLFGDGESISA